MIPIKFYKFVLAFIMSLFMSFLMSGVLLYINLGIIDRFLILWAEGWFKAFVVAYPSVIFIMPFATKLTKKICKNE
ncbi:DUF2798 domain-containing protein [Campylobacter sp. RM16190]|uniref:DUF2798 domain-containing protein n=1 Tax=Campylobacter sp. RM16190 TaxID=1705727 RepID=UPI001474454C|nr:DUF2798 domain-containing protein [Campylobacter sp. RM16190]